MKNSRRGKVHAETRRSRRYEGCAFLFSASSAPPRENGARAMASLITFVSSAPDGRQGHECQSEVETPQPGLNHEETLGEGRFTRRRGERGGMRDLLFSSPPPPRLRVRMVLTRWQAVILAAILRSLPDPHPSLRMTHGRVWASGSDLCKAAKHP